MASSVRTSTVNSRPNQDDTSVEYSNIYSNHNDHFTPNKRFLSEDIPVEQVSIFFFPLLPNLLYVQKMWALEQNSQSTVESQRDGVVFGDGVVQAVATNQNGQMYLPSNWTQGMTLILSLGLIFSNLFI